MQHPRLPRRSIVFLLVAVCACAIPASSQVSAPLHNKEGLTLLVAPDIAEPMLRVLLPNRPQSDTTISVVFPEHVTARKHGSNTAEQLYLFQPGESGEPPVWRRTANSIQYEIDLKDDIHLLARAKLEDDGVLFHYELTNGSATSFDMIYAVTDPRLTGIFHDVRLERTYVHHSDGFDLLASETPERLTMPLKEWLPARYLASYTWPVPASKVEVRPDHITYYNKSRPVDEPMIATVSIDRKWIVTSFARTTGNVWSNPELTCQHVDPQASLAPGATAVLEVKILIFQGTLDQALQKVIAQRKSLQ